MRSIIVDGPARLSGSVHVPGAKNSVLPILAASLLCTGTVVLRNVPRLTDVQAALEIHASLGCTAALHGHTISLCADGMRACDIPHSLAARMRSSVFYLAPLLARTGRAALAAPGGCDLGPRPVDIHIDGLCAMGAHVVQESGGASALTAPRGLHCADYTLRFPSVGATETLLMAACAARGVSVLRGVAVEPEVVDLARFLRSAGAEISGEGTRCITVRGRGALLGTQYDVCADRIVAATVLCAAAACGGEVIVDGCPARQLEPLVSLLRRAGCAVAALGTDSVALSSDGALRGLGLVQTGVYPAFPTDMAPLLGAAVLRADGISVIRDTIFPNRFVCAQGFAVFGARCGAAGESLVVSGVRSLNGAQAAAPDLRGGAALVIAAMSAHGESVIDNAHHIERGYEDISGLFTPLGAHLETACGCPCAV